MKNIRNVALTALALSVIACGSQVVEFPLDETTFGNPPPVETDAGDADGSTNDGSADAGSSSDSSVGYKDATVPGTDSGAGDDDGGTCSCPTTNDGGHSGGDSGSVTDGSTSTPDATVNDGGGGGGAGDASTPDGSTTSDGGSGGSTDGGPRTCGKSRKTCDDYRNYGQCVSSCAHECKGTHGKHHKDSCRVFSSCFKECKATCDCLKDMCRNDPRCED